MGDIIDESKASSAVSIVGSPPNEANNGNYELYRASVILEDGIYKLATTKKVNVESLAGVQGEATNYIEFETVSLNDTLRIEIDATPQTPALDKTFTVLAGENRFTFAARVALELNQDFVDFQPYFKCTQVKNNSILFFETKYEAEAGSNVNANSFRVTGTGTIASTLIRAFDDWVPRTSTIRASKSVTDPRLGIFGISGTVESKDASVEGLYIQKPYDTVSTAINLNVDGSVTPKVFTFPMDALDDIFINEIKFFGRDNGVQFSNFLGKNGSLTNGILIEIKTNNNTIALPPIKTTDDFDDIFSFGGSNFDVYFASGADKFSARFLASAFPLRRTGTFGVGNDDYIKITIRDNLTDVTYLQSVVSGFRQEA